MIAHADKEDKENEIRNWHKWRFFLPNDSFKPRSTKKTLLGPAKPWVTSDFLKFIWSGIYSWGSF